MTAREIAFRVLLNFEDKKPRLDDLLKESYSKYNISMNERKLLKNITSGVIRNLLYLDWIASQIYHGRYKKLLKKIKVILRMALYEIIFVDHIPTHATINEYVNLAKKMAGAGSGGQVNGMLRTYVRESENLKPENSINVRAELIAVKYSFPEWLVKRWINVWGETETESICRALNTIPEFDIRVNAGKISVSDFKDLLAENKITFQVSKHFEDMLTIKDIQAIRNNDWFDEGLCSIQDESAHIPVELLDLRAGDRVLDICAAPGGKYTQILKYHPDQILAVAVDQDFERLKKVRDNVQRLGFKNRHFIVADGRALPFKPVFNKILLDAPCSGLGVINKHPDIKWRRDIGQIIEFAKLQDSILSQAGNLLANDGNLVYSTCTVDPMENEMVIHDFMERNADQFELSEPPLKFGEWVSDSLIRTFPHRDHKDGSFCALLHKKASFLDE
ncbi:MAG: 16S rRNA (cytosine(967)-C(5))-methyltransferase RsmB [Calditrichaceae bacterium]